MCRSVGVPEDRSFLALESPISIQCFKNNFEIMHLFKGQTTLEYYCLKKTSIYPPVLMNLVEKKRYDTQLFEMCHAVKFAKTKI